VRRLINLAFVFLLVCHWPISYAAVNSSLISKNPQFYIFRQAGHKVTDISGFIKEQQALVENYIDANYSGDASQYSTDDALITIGTFSTVATATPQTYTVLSRSGTGYPEIQIHTASSGSINQHVDDLKFKSSAIVDGNNNIVGWDCVVDADSNVIVYSNSHCNRSASVTFSN